MFSITFCIFINQVKISLLKILDFIKKSLKWNLLGGRRKQCLFGKREKCFAILFNFGQGRSVRASLQLAAAVKEEAKSAFKAEKEGKERPRTFAREGHLLS
jgi:hypothetical protein